ncbi:hypothetical protein [Arthrobacter rhombi]|uniref:hypothetical protein n=1 Tax=Arthrobacter rhombi TaxID=71253 RepID=UPI003FD0F33D
MNEFHPLGSLIQEAMDRNGWSLRYLSKRASDAGSPMSHTNLGRIKDDPVISLKADTIKLLAKILQISEFRVAQAALDSMGIAHASRRELSIEDVVRTSTEISAYDQQLLTAMLTVMRLNKGDTNDYQEQAEANPSGERVAGEGGGRGGVGSGEKMMSVVDDDEAVPLDLVAHPRMELDRDRFDKDHGEAGEESQAAPEDD